MDCIIGILGFVLSLIVFALTRWECRKTATIDLEIVHGEKFKDEVGGDYEETMLIIHVINTGPRAIVIDKNTIKAIGSKKAVHIYDTDWFGLNSIPHPLNPGEHFEVGLFLESFTHFQGYKGFSKDIIPISAELSDIKNKIYKPKSKYILLLEVDDIRRIT